MKNDIVFIKLWTKLPQVLNTNDNPVYKHRASNQTITECLGQEMKISNNRFSLSVSMDGTTAQKMKVSCGFGQFTEENGEP